MELVDARQIVLHELFDKPSEWDWVSDYKDWKSAEFRVGGNRYLFNAEGHGSSGKGGEWDVAFRLTDAPDQYGITGTGNAERVFATVLDIMRSFIKAVQPDEITFSGKETSRIRLYTSLIKRFAKKHGYRLEKSERAWEGGSMEFMLVKA